MRQQLFGLVAIMASTVLVGSGCTVCTSPYDYCGPVFAGGECDMCLVHERVGSVIADPGIGPWGELSPAPSSESPSEADPGAFDQPSLEDMPAPDEGEDIPFPGEAPQDDVLPISTASYGIQLRR